MARTSPVLTTDAVSHDEVMDAWATERANAGDKMAMEFLRLRAEAKRVAETTQETIEREAQHLSLNERPVLKTKADTRKTRKVKGAGKSSSDTTTESEADAGEYKTSQMNAWEEGAAINHVPPRYLQQESHLQLSSTFGDVRYAEYLGDNHAHGSHFRAFRDAHGRRHLTQGLNEVDADFVAVAPGAAYIAPVLWELMCATRDIDVRPRFVECTLLMGHGSLPTPITSGFAYPVGTGWNLASLVSLFRPDSTDMRREVEKLLTRAAIDHGWTAFCPNWPVWTTEFFNEDKGYWLPLEALALFPHRIGPQCAATYTLRARITVLHQPVFAPVLTEAEFRKKYHSKLSLTGMDVALAAMHGQVRFQRRQGNWTSAWHDIPVAPYQRRAHLQALFNDVCDRAAVEEAKAKARHEERTAAAASTPRSPVPDYIEGEIIPYTE
jgi:hypothetical protein